MITILIPTLNRSRFLLRALRYLEKMRFGGAVLIGDSSDKEHTEAITDFVKSTPLNINYQYFPSKDYPTDGHCMKKMISLVETPYAVYQGDDDILIPSSLKKCVEFLEKNKDYVAAFGLRANVYYDGNTIKAGHLSRAPEYLQDDPIERWDHYMRTGLSTQNHVHRTETWKQMYEHVDMVPSRYIGPELLPCSMSMILGKVKFVDCLHYVFHKEAPDRQVDWDKESFFDLFNKPEWSPSVGVFRESIVSALTNQGIDIFTAKESFKYLFNLHVVMVLSSQLQALDRPKPVPENQLYKILLNPQFPHYPDFRQVLLGVS